MFLKPVVLSFFLFFSACSFQSGKDFLSLVLFKQRLSLEDRLLEFKDKKWNTNKPVEIRWDKYAVPYIKAQTDRDLFYATGAVQAHLRGAQLEIFRRLSQGRLSELVGAKTIDMDIFLRTINLGQASDEIIKSWPKEIKLHAMAFLKGINDYNKQINRMPIDLKLMGVADIKPWTLKELVYIHRLMGSDVNWNFWPKIIKVYNQLEKDEYTEYWQKWVTPLFKKKQMEISALDSFRESGSNAFAISGTHTKSGKPIVAGDPHLGITVPNFWLFMHQKSPSFNTLGIAMPSFPVAAMGRNKHLAWTGTNMWGLSSYLFEVSKEELKKAKVRKEVFKLRFSKDRFVDVLETSKGPIISNTNFLKSNQPLAIHWSGHIASKELESLYKANKATNIDEFKEAFRDYGVVALNYVVADKNGDISKIHVTQLPVLKKESKTYIQKNTNTVTGYYNVFDFPENRNPERGFVVSSNEYVEVNRQPACWFCSVGERMERIVFLLEDQILRGQKIDIPLVKRIQQDVYYKDGKDIINKFFKIYGDKKVRLPKSFELLLSWDLFYTKEALAPHLFEEMVKNFSTAVFNKSNLSKAEALLARAHYSWRQSIFKKFDSLNLDDQRDILEELTEDLNRLRVRPWGEVHKIKLAHNFGGLPIIGRFFTLYKGPYPGSVATVFKGAFKDSGKKTGVSTYKVGFGANLRVIFDLSDPNENYGIILGGQDGFWGSKQIQDQIKFWLEGEYIWFPFEDAEINQNKAQTSVLR